MADKIRIKGVVKTTPSSSTKRKVVKPKFHKGSAGLLTDKIIVTVKKEKSKEKKKQEQRK